MSIPFPAHRCDRLKCMYGSSYELQAIIRALQCLIELYTCGVDVPCAPTPAFLSCRSVGCEALTRAYGQLRGPGILSVASCVPTFGVLHTALL